MNLKEYNNFTKTTAIYPEAGSGNLNEVMYLTLGLSGEVGEISNKVKKLYRDGNSSWNRQQLSGELGDVFWYLIRLCDVHKLDPEMVMLNNVNKLTSRKNRNVLGGSGDTR